MRSIIPLIVLCVLLALACGDSPEPKGQPTPPIGPPPVMQESGLTTWALPEDKFGDDKLILPIRTFQGSEFPALDTLDPKRYVTFTKGTNGRYYGYIGGIVFILDFS